MVRTTRLTASVVLLLWALPAAGQQLENSHTPATSGTTRQAGRTRLGDTPAGAPGPSYETRMPRQRPVDVAPNHGPAQAGAPDTTRELFQH